MQSATSDLPHATHVESHDKRKLLPLAGNAFRLLGLSCHATQKEIYASAASIRRAIKLGVDRTPAHHLNWLNAPALTETSVRDALSRLADPAQRIYERFYWFFEPQLIETDLNFPSLQKSVERLREAAQPSAGHDIALLSLAVMLRLDPHLSRVDEWRRIYALWKELIEAKEFWSLLVAADLTGDFEQVTTFGEVKNLRGRAWRLITSPVVEIAKDGIHSDDLPLVQRALAVLRRSELPQVLAEEYENEILAPVEDKFEAILGEAFLTSRFYVKSSQNVAERRETCYRMRNKFEEDVRPALKKIFELAGARSPVTRRVCEAAAEALDELADGFESAFESAASLKTLRLAWQLAPPESATLLLIEEHLQAAGDERERKEKTDGDFAHQLYLALVREPLALPELFTSYMQKEGATKRSEGCVGLLSKVVLALLFAVFIGKCFSNLPGSRRYNNLPPPMNYNVAMPRFSPSPMPELKLKNLVFHIPPDMLEVGMILKTVLVVDVRTKNEYDAGHIAGALSIPAEQVAARAKRLPKFKRLVLYDGGAELAARAALYLQALGFTEVAVLEGGYQAWLNSGRSVKQPKATTRGSKRPVVTGTREPQ